MSSQEEFEKIRIMAIIEIDDSKINQPATKLGFSSVVYAFVKFINLPDIDLKEFKGIDLGCGIGSISVLLLKKFNNLVVTGIDLDEESVELSSNTAVLSGVEERYSSKCLDIRSIHEELKEKSINLVFTNPPYFKIGNGRLPLKASMALAKHELAGTMNDFLKSTKYLLKKSGKAYILQHASRSSEVFSLVAQNDMVVSRVQFIYTNGSKDAINIMAEILNKTDVQTQIMEPLYLKDGNIVE